MELFSDSTLLLPLVFTFIVYLLSLTIYRLYSHTLCRFPGPKLAAITRYYEAYYDVFLNGQYTFKIAALHQTYRAIMRISPHELHVSDLAFYKKLFRQDGRWNKYARSYDTFSAKYSSICTGDHELHKRRRAPLNNFFSKNTVASRQQIIYTRVNKLCDRIDKYVGTKFTLNLGTAVSAFAGNVAQSTSLGKAMIILDARISTPI
ncbi:cytochrome P450 [Massariosphaeria phaeospora]|uniref:Cytochrome P450 n=1 Tax=Massariosphaeria phaeospora TaxID=100035 RepID=A0A7C8M4S6_9PLEO|nr:cytochrome P450 [Massariosphaeria phaeospora]